MRGCRGCGARLAADQRESLCSPCARTVVDAPRDQPAEFWLIPAVQDALAAQHFGILLKAYRYAHQPVLTQTAVARWLDLSQAQVSRLERPGTPPPSDLTKLCRWADVLRIPADLLWFGSSRIATSPRTVDAVDRRNLLKLAGAAAATGALVDPPWKRLADTLAGSRAPDTATVTAVENKTRSFFEAEETIPARQLVATLRKHYRTLKSLTENSTNEGLRRRLLTSAGETEALAGWTMFDIGRPAEAAQVFRQALDTARAAGDPALATCILGYWSYLLASDGDTPAAVRMLADASEHVRGSDAATQAWILARRAEEQAMVGDTTSAVRSLDQAVAVFDYVPAGPGRPWTSFFTANRLGSLAVSTYGRMGHRETDDLAASLLSSLTPTETKVKALVLADLATSVARHGDYDRLAALTDNAAPLATRTEASLAIGRLWDVVELIPADATGTPREVRGRLTAQLSSA